MKSNTNAGKPLPTLVFLKFDESQHDMLQLKDIE